MRSITLGAKVPEDAKLILEVPSEFIGKDAVITVLFDSEPSVKQWRDRLDALAGCLEDPTFEAPLDLLAEPVEPWS